MDPVLHRFLSHMAALEIDGRSPVPPAGEDPWVTTVLEPCWDAMPAAASALANAAQHFPTASAAVRRLTACHCSAVQCRHGCPARLGTWHVSRKLWVTTMLNRAETC